ncbi:MAG: FAD-dependent monooxygenase [Acetobacteraceae bacterium]|nr:FAD-dependent monooxygenase [Acetobacteraceae bacterium]
MHAASSIVTYDTAIVGGGLAGSIIATLLARAGRSVALIDLHPVYPPDFRAEQLVGEQITQLAELGLLDAIVDGRRPVMHAVAARRGRVIGRVDAPHYGIRYEHMVARVRAQIPPSVSFTTGRVVDVITGTNRQQVILADGSHVAARLVVLASGLQQALLRRLGFTHRRTRDAHSLTFGYDIVPAQEQNFPYPVLVYSGERVADRIDYLTIFPMDGTIRANLFTYRDVLDPWSQAFRQAPHAMLLTVLPRLERVLGPFRVASQVQTRVTDLHSVANPVRDGIVLVGDGFQTSCPAAGTGVSRLLTDIDCLCNTHVPRWLDTPGMAADKIAAFYADPRKAVSDAKAASDAEYRRSVTTEGSLRWRLHRLQFHIRQRVGGWVGGPQRLTAGMRPLGALGEAAREAGTMGPFLPETRPVPDWRSPA